MMERIWLALVCLSSWRPASCVPRQYHYVSDPMTWTEALTYCKQKHTDLASIRSSEEMGQLLSTVSPNTASAVWIGLYSEIKWKWSDGYIGDGADYRSWYGTEPNFYHGRQICVSTDGDGNWADVNCLHELPFLCIEGTQQNPSLVLVLQQLDWLSAQKYCREKYIDLATLKGDADKQTIKLLLDHGLSLIGLHRDPNMIWSDGSAVTFTNWDSAYNPLGSRGGMCGSADLQKSGKWSLVPCEDKNPFVCYSPGTHQQVIKLRMKVEDSSVDLNDPAVKADILKKLQDKLRETATSGLTLKWRQQPDGKVFHKQEESPQMKKGKKTEF